MVLCVFVSGLFAWDLVLKLLLPFTSFFFFPSWKNFSNGFFEKVQTLE